MACKPYVYSFLYTKTYHESGMNPKRTLGECSKRVGLGKLTKSLSALSASSAFVGAGHVAAWDVVRTATVSGRDTLAINKQIVEYILHYL